MNTETALTVSSKMHVIVPPAQLGICVSLGEWDALRRKIERIHSGSRLSAFAGPFLWGAAASFLSTAVLQGKSALPWILFAAALVCAVIWLILSHESRQFSAWTKEDVLEEMDRLKETRIPSENGSAKRPPLVLTDFKPV